MSKVSAVNLVLLMHEPSPLHLHNSIGYILFLCRNSIGRQISLSELSVLMVRIFFTPQKLKRIPIENSLLVRAG